MLAVRRAVVFVLLVIVAACSSTGGVSPAASPAADGAAAGGTPVVVSDAWIQPPLGRGGVGGAYFTMTGGSAADALLRAATPSAGAVEIHETMAQGSGMMGMRPVERIDVGAGATVRLEPGGYHLMLLDMPEVPAEGSTVELTLTFEHAGAVTVPAVVRPG